MFGVIALIKPLLDGIGIKGSVDKYAPMERNCRTISNGEVCRGHDNEPPHLSNTACFELKTGQKSTHSKKLAASFPKK